MSAVTEQQRVDLVSPFYLQLLHMNFLSAPDIDSAAFAKALRARFTGVETQTIRVLLDDPGWRESLVGGWAVAMRQESTLIDLVPGLLRERKGYGFQGYCIALAAVPSPDGVAALTEHIEQESSTQLRDRMTTRWALSALGLIAESDATARTFFESFSPPWADADKLVKRDVPAQVAQMKTALGLMQG